MRPFTVEDVAKATNGKIYGNKDAIIRGVERDSRLLGDDWLFVAINGARVDGHDFIDNVLKNGAGAALCDHIPEGVTGNCIVVEDSVKALQDLAEWYRNTLDVTIVGISGSVGKTSTKEIVSAVLSEKYKVFKTPGNYNNEIGLPLTVLMVDDDTDVVVLEMGISDFGEMTVLAKVSQPDICVLTNIGQSHLEALGTRDGILKAKTEMFAYRNPDGPVYLNGDDDKLSTVSDVDGTKPIFFGFSEKNEIHAEKVDTLGLDGTNMTVCLGDNKFDASITMIGRHMVSNALVASAIGEYLGMSNEQIVKGLSKAESIEGRSHLIAREEGFIIDDCYNAAPNSMMAGIDTLCLVNRGRRVAVLGDMFELGTDEKKMHYEVGEFAADMNLDLLICVGELAKSLYEGAMSRNPSFEVIHYDTLEDCKNNICSLLTPTDNILVKASNGMHFKELLEIIK